MTDTEKFEIGLALNYIAMVLSDSEFEKVEGKLKEIETIVISETSGKWLREDGRVWSRCSVCGNGSSFETKYCGSCGAKMEGCDVDVSE